MKTTDVTTLIEPRLIRNYDVKHGTDIRGEYKKFERDMMKSLVLIFLLIFLGFCGGAKSMTFFGPFYASIFIPLENDIGGFARLVEMLFNVFSPFVVSMLPFLICYKFIPFFSDKNHGVVVSEFKDAVAKFRECYYTGAPDVVLTEELIRKNLVLMARRVLLEKRICELLENSGWASEKARNEAQKIYLEAVQILDDALVSMCQFDLAYSKQAVFAQAENGN